MQEKKCNTLKEKEKLKFKNQREKSQPNFNIQQKILWKVELK